MSIARGVQLAEAGPNVDRDRYEAARPEKDAKEARQQRSVEANDPIIANAVETVKQVSESLGRTIDVEWEEESGLAVISIYSQDGEKLIRKVPPEDLIRTAERMKDRRAQYLDDVF